MDLVGYKDLRGLGIPFSTQHINRLINAGKFPRPIRSGDAVSCKRFWLRSDIEAWINERIKARDEVTK